MFILFLYAFLGTAVIAWYGRIRPARAAAQGGVQGTEATAPMALVAGPANRRRALAGMLVALGVCAVVQCLFATTYMSAGHAPKATDMPFGAVGASPVLPAAEKNISLKVTPYEDEAAARTAMDQARIYGALISSGSTNTLIVMPSMSDLAPLDLAAKFKEAAKATSQTLTVQPYAPTPLAAKDPLGLVQGLMMLPLLIGGYMISTLLLARTGRAAGR
ncbi:hypothetical protein [Streptomyces sp. NPDC005548]|uniref:hypothetical protein n=1 Tax=Streptomyces sp. NPDC005548 TaxID=3364724 RepID=UPI0036B672E4